MSPAQRRPPRALLARTRRRRRALGWVLLPPAVLLLAYLAWPYISLWRLDRAVRGEEAEALATLVDLASVRGEIKKKLNKDVGSRLGPVSDRFIRWLQAGIQSLGSDAIDRLVTLDWVREQLLVHSPGGAADGFLGEVSFAFFDARGGFQVHIGPPDDGPVRLHLERHGLAWRVSALSY
ncbi:MAG: DUF2939 domain-containing protein [Chromatiaceae bacterium]|nr:DUF2939 domain-containing protein [Chromatiaceae bacterium]